MLLALSAVCVEVEVWVLVFGLFFIPWCSNCFAHPPIPMSSNLVFERDCRVASQIATESLFRGHLGVQQVVPHRMGKLS